MTQAIHVADRKVSRVAIIDDDQHVRDVYGYTVEEADLSPVPYDQQLPAQPGQAVEAFTRNSDAALCDNRLMVSGYAKYNGTKLVQTCYERSFPAILCTSYEANADEWRYYLPWMPVRLKETELDPDALRSGIEICLKELTAGRREDRRPWRTLVRVEEVEARSCFVVVPAWDTTQKVRLLLDDLPSTLASVLTEDLLCHAAVNLGAESLEDLFFMDWETP